MKMTLEVEVDRQMLETIIDLWKAKWREEEVEDDDAEDESEDLDDDSENEDECDHIFPETTEERAHRKALEKLSECLRSNGIADVDFVYRRHAVRRNRRG